MDITGHVGIELFQEPHITDYASGTKTAMTDDNVSEKLINMHVYWRILAKLYSTSLFPKRFGFIKKQDSVQWLRGNIPKRWNLASVIPNMWQWIERFGTED